MAFNNLPASSLSRFSVGEIVDLAGVPDFYDAGSSKWLRSATLTSSSNLNTTSKTNLASAGTATAPTVIAQSALSASYVERGPYASYPIPRISASNVSVVPAYYTANTTVGVGVMTSVGLQMVETGQTSLAPSDSTHGNNAFIASNDTTIFSYTFTSATALSAYTTTNGTTWTAGSVTGLPTFAATSSTLAHASGSSGTNYTVAGVRGWKRQFNNASYTQFAVFWCGARFLLIGPGATNYVCSLSSDGLAWSGDETNNVISSTSVTKNNAFQFYRNGNNCFLNVGSFYRFSTNGGVSWNACTFASSGSVNPGTYYLGYNTTDPAKITISLNQETFFSADSGATWSANRGIGGLSNTQGGFFYKGSTVVVSDGNTQYKVSTNDGVSYVTPTFPIGTLGTSISFAADANRFYAGVNYQSQMLTSSDAVTWTIVTLTANFALSAIATNAGYGIVSFNSNTVAMIGYNNQSGGNQAVFTTNGGVTWTLSQYAASDGGSWQVGATAYTTPDASGIGFIYGGATYGAISMNNVFLTDLSGGGAFYRTGTTTIAPTRTNARAFVRVG